MDLGAVKLERLVLKDRLLALLKEAIFNGKLRPGERIVEMKVASDFGVATTSVREALFELESQGLVTRITNKGTFVTELTPDDVEQIVRVRHALEGLAAELAEQHATPDDIARLTAIVGDMEASARIPDPDRFYKADLEFHRLVWAMSGNRHLTRALDTTVVPLFAFSIMRNQTDDVVDLLAIAESHRRIAHAIGSRRGSREAMEQALTRGRERP